MDKVLPFRCTKCNREYVPEEGGICSVCHQPFCAAHLRKAIKGAETIYVCEQHSKEFLNAKPMISFGNFGLTKSQGIVLIAAMIILFVFFILFILK